MLIDTCTIERFTQGAQDDYGHPLQSWTGLHVSIPCRKVFGKGTEIKVGQEVHIVRDELYVEDLDVTTQDRVLLGGEYWDILDVGHYTDSVGPHHKKLYIEKVR